jgi:hypothetical protein
MEQQVVEELLAALKQTRAWEKRVLELEREWSVTEGLLRDCERVLAAVPECSVHGRCIPHAINWINDRKAINLKATRPVVGFSDVIALLQAIGTKDGYVELAVAEDRIVDLFTKCQP